MPKTSFLPSRHGFHFPNAFSNVLLKTPSGEISARGRCGGMAYGALDYFSNNAPIPNCIDNDIVGIHDFGSGAPPDGTILADFFMLRLMTSLVQYGYTSLMWNLSSDHDTWSYHPGVVPATKENEWPKLQALLDQGRPTVIGLVSASGNISDAHQVVAFDYKLTLGRGGNQSVVISIYDCNLPDDDTVTLTSTVDTWTNPHWNEANSSTRKVGVWRGFWVEDGTPASWWGLSKAMQQNYVAPAVVDFTVGLGGMPAMFEALSPLGFSGGSLEQELLSDITQLMNNPPNPGSGSPPLIDLVLTRPITPSAVQALIGDPYRPELTITNQGPYRAHAKLFSLASGDPRLDVRLRDSKSLLDLAPGRSFSPSLKSTIRPNQSSGNFSLTAKYLTMEGHVVLFPGASGIVNSASLTILPSPTVQILLLAETQQVTEGPAGITVGGWNVELQAVTAPAHFKPVRYSWMIDPRTRRRLTASGETVTVFLPVASKGQPPVYRHNVAVAAVDSHGGGATASYLLIFDNPRASLMFHPDLQSAVQVSSKTFDAGQSWIKYDVSNYSMIDGMLEDVSYFFAPVDIVWSPQPAGLQNGGLTAVYPINGEEFRVNATLSDAIGQALTLTGWLTGTIVRTIHGPGWRPPPPPVPSGVSQTSIPGRIVSRLIAGNASGGNPSLGGIRSTTTSGSKKGTVLTGEELANHVMLVPRLGKNVSPNKSRRKVNKKRRQRR